MPRRDRDTHCGHVRPQKPPVPTLRARAHTHSHSHSRLRKPRTHTPCGQVRAAAAPTPHPRPQLADPQAQASRGRAALAPRPRTRSGPGTHASPVARRSPGARAHRHAAAARATAAAPALTARGQQAEGQRHEPTAAAGVPPRHGARLGPPPQPPPPPPRATTAAAGGGRAGRQWPGEARRRGRGRGLGGPGPSGGRRGGRGCRRLARPSIAILGEQPGRGRPASAAAGPAGDPGPAHRDPARRGALLRRGLRPGASPSPGRLGPQLGRLFMGLFVPWTPCL